MIFLFEMENDIEFFYDIYGDFLISYTHILSPKYPHTYSCICSFSDDFIVIF